MLISWLLVVVWPRYCASTAPPSWMSYGQFHKTGELMQKFQTTFFIYTVIIKFFGPTLVFINFNTAIRFYNFKLVPFRANKCAMSHLFTCCTNAKCIKSGVAKVSLKCHCSVPSVTWSHTQLFHHLLSLEFQTPGSPSNLFLLYSQRLAKLVLYQGYIPHTTPVRLPSKPASELSNEQNLPTLELWEQVF